MARMKIIRLVSVVVLLIKVQIAICGSVDGCEMSRITIPLTEYNGQVTCAASFMYGEYAQNPRSIDDMLKSSHLIARLNQLSEESRWKYPEYIVIRHFEQLKTGNKEQALLCFEPGHSRNKEDMRLKDIEKIKAFLQPFSQVVFLDKSCFGPYVRIFYFLREVPKPGSKKKGRGIPHSIYLRLVGNRFMITNEIDETHLFAEVVSKYGAKKIIDRKDIPLDPDTTNMEWFDLDVDIGSSPANKKILHRFSTEQKSQLMGLFSDNYLRIYVNCESLNIQLEAGRELPGLSPELRFFESAVTAYWTGTEAEILQTWSGKSKELVERDIHRLKTYQKWPETRLSPFGKSPKVLALLQTSVGKIIYMKGKYSFSASCVALLGDSKEGYSLSFVNNFTHQAKDIFRHKVFLEAVEVLYAIGEKEK